jgi:hypothetical protein
MQQAQDRPIFALGLQPDASFADREEKSVEPSRAAASNQRAPNEKAVARNHLALIIDDGSKHPRVGQDLTFDTFETTDKHADR